MLCRVLAVVVVIVCVDEMSFNQSMSVGCL